MLPVTIMVIMLLSGDDNIDGDAGDEDEDDDDEWSESCWR